MKRLLVVSHRPLDQAGGPTARWRSFRRYLPEHGWEVDVLTAAAGPGAVEFTELPDERRRVEARARLMSAVGRLSSPAFALAGVRPDAVPLSMAWVPRGARAVRRRVESIRPHAVLATGPPMAGVLAARLALGSGAPPLVVELRDLWAGNPAFDIRGGLLTRTERRILSRARAIVACTPEAAADLRHRHPAAAARVHEIPNGFEPELLGRRARDARAQPPLTLLHSGTLTAGRPLAPLLRVLARDPYRSAFKLVLHGYVAPPIAAQLASADGRCDLSVLPPSPWAEAIDRMAQADATLVTQARAAGDQTAVAAKVFEYLALGKPVLCLSDGGATEALLRRLGAARFCARLGDEGSIAAALDRLLDDPAPDPLPPEALADYDRRRLAARLADVLDQAAG